MRTERWWGPTFFAASLTAAAHGGIVTEVAMVKPSEADHRFGVDIALSGSRAVVGARIYRDGGNQGGAAYVLDLTDPGQPVKVAILAPDDGSDEDRFGRSVALDGTLVLVGASLDFDDGTGIKSGGAYLFDADTGVQTAKLVSPDGDENDFFGTEVMLNDGIALIGAAGDDEHGEDAGAVYVFDVSMPSQPVHLAKLFPNGGESIDGFGRSIAASAVRFAGWPVRSLPARWMMTAPRCWSERRTPAIRSSRCDAGFLMQRPACT